MDKSKLEKVDLSLDGQAFTQRYGRKKSLATHTLGCKVNQSETEAMTGAFLKEGYELVDFEDPADVYVINTCTVTNIGDRKSRQFIRKALDKNSEAFIAVVGCYAQIAPEKVEEIPGVKLIVGTSERANLVHLVERAAATPGVVNTVRNIMDVYEFEDLGLTEFKGRTRAFVKIQEGCDQYCTYCIIPYARGHVRSRRPESVLLEVEDLAKRGFREIVLTGIHIGSYGKDLKEGNLLELLKAIHQIEGIKRIRIGSVEPGTMTDEFLETIKNMGKLCKHFHLSLQSGSDGTLRRMNRKYTTEQYFSTVEKIRMHMPEAALSTDVIVGFPGETAEEFEETRKFIEKVDFSTVHVFKYSPREGTPAAKFKNQVSGAIKDERSKIIMEITDRSAERYRERFLGRTLEVLIEQEVQDMPGWFDGITENYLEVRIPMDHSGLTKEEIEGNIFSIILESIERGIIIGKQV